MFPPRNGPFIPSQDDFSPHFNPPEVALAKIDREIASLRESIRALHSFRNTFIPIARLPTNVLTEIFLFLGLGSPLGASSGSSKSFRWLAITRVCQNWRNVAHSTPTLWTRIRGSYSPRTIAKFIQYSKTAPLSVYCEHSSQVQRFLPFIEDTLPRLRDLQVEVSDPTSVIDTLLGVLSSPAPLLTSLQLHGKPSRMLRLSAPNLRYLDISSCSMDITSPLEHLTDLKIRSPIKKMHAMELLTALRNLPSLTSLLLLEVLEHGVAKTVASTFGIVTLRFLKSLSITGPTFTQYLDILWHLSLPNDTTVEFTSSTQSHNPTSDLTNFLTVYAAHRLQSSESIQRCSIDLTLQWNEDNLTLQVVRGATVTGLDRLGCLYLKINGPWHHNFKISDGSELASHLLSFSSLTNLTTNCDIGLITWKNICQSSPKLASIHAERDSADNLVSVITEDYTSSTFMADNTSTKGGQQKGRGGGKGGNGGNGGVGQNQSIGWTPIIPELERLEIWKLDFSADRLEELIDALRARKLAGRKLEVLSFLGCKRAQEKKKELKSIVGTTSF